MLYFNLIHRDEVEMKFTLYDQTNPVIPAATHITASSSSKSLDILLKIKLHSLSPITDHYM